MFVVYILKNNQGKIYIGSTSDLNRRLEEHNITGTGFTSKYRPWVVIHTESFQSRPQAMKREKYLKTGAGRDWIKINITRP
jgi:putative endonuclease